MSVEFHRESPGKFASRTLNRKTLNRWTGRGVGSDRSWCDDFVGGLGRVVAIPFFKVLRLDILATLWWTEMSKSGEFWWTSGEFLAILWKSVFNKQETHNKIITQPSHRCLQALIRWRSPLIAPRSDDCGYFIINRVESEPTRRGPIFDARNILAIYQIKRTHNIPHISNT